MPVVLVEYPVIAAYTRAGAVLLSCAPLRVRAEGATSRDARDEMLRLLDRRGANQPGVVRWEVWWPLTGPKLRLVQDANSAGKYDLPREE